MESGHIIVIDGLDGCGKATQVISVTNRLKEMGYKVKNITFPEYSSLSSGPVRMYLNGEIGTDPMKLNPYMCSLFYAVDRAIQFHKEIFKYYNEGYIIIADRYLSANIIHQASKCKDIDEMHEFFRWVYEIETEKIGIPREDITIALTLPVEVSQKLMMLRYHNDESSKDIHESNIEYLNKCRSSLEEACKYLPTIGYNWIKYDCSTPDMWIKQKDEITNNLLDLILPIIKN